MNVPARILLALAKLVQTGEEQNKEPMVFPTVEPEVGPWLNNPKWGQIFQNPLPAVEDAVIPVGNIDRTVGPPKVHTVQLFRSDVISTDTANSDVIAQVTYGIGAVRNSFEVDWKQGAQFSLLASTITVNAVTRRVSSPAAYAAGGNQVILGVGFGEGNVGRESITWTAVTPNLAAAGGSESVDVPDFAQAVRVSTNATNKALLSVQLIARAFPFDEYTVDIFNSMAFLPIPRGIRQVKVINNDPGVAHPATVSFSLSL